MTRSTLVSVVGAAKRRVFDVNLRPPHVDEPAIASAAAGEAHGCPARPPRDTSRLGTPAASEGSLAAQQRAFVSASLPGAWLIKLNDDELPELAATPIAPVGYTCADLWGEEAEAPLAAADVAFSYSVTWESEDGYLTALSSLLARRLSDGARACTVDLKLRSDADASFDLLATVTGCNPETGEGTVGYVWRVRKPP